MCMKHVSVVESRQDSTKAKYLKVIETNIHNPLICC